MHNIPAFCCGTAAMNMLRLRKRPISKTQETNEIVHANSHQQIWKLIKDGWIVQSVTVHFQSQRWKDTLAQRTGRPRAQVMRGCDRDPDTREGDMDVSMGLLCRLLWRYQDSKK